jgi:hypothetical protein
MVWIRRFLPLAAFLLICLPCWANSIDASGYYWATGEVTIVGTTVGACGSSPCVEDLKFSIMVQSVLYSVGTGNTPDYYLTEIVGGPGVTQASGPLVGSWTIGLGPYYLEFGNQFSDATLDVPGFIDFLTGLPETVASPGFAYLYFCGDPICAEFSGTTGYLAGNGFADIEVKQVAEPESLFLLINGFVILGLLVPFREKFWRAVS